MSDSATIVQKLWNYCNVLRDDGLSYQDYIEQLTFLLFLKMADEQTKPPFSRPAIVPAGLDWATLHRLDGDALDVQYRHTLVELGKQPGTLGVIFRKAQNKVQDPAKLKRLVSDLIEKEQWMTLDADVKGDAYEGLLAKNAEDVKTGAGQYFTPRALIQAVVDVMRPTASMRVADPACGTGGFLLSAYEHMKSDHLDRDEKKFLRDDALRGWEIVDATARICAMNLLLHGIGTPEGDSLVTVDDSLRAQPSSHFDMVLTNPPFGKKSSYKVINAEGNTESESMSYLREDFWATTSNKQLNFLQHVRSLLEINGRAAIVVPDNVLFFDRKPPSERPWTKKLWIYDFRTNQSFTLKERQLVRSDLDDFVACYNADNREERVETECFRPFTYDELLARDKASLDIFWLRDESLEDTDNLPAPEVIAAEIVEDLQAALDEFSAIAATVSTAARAS